MNLHASILIVALLFLSPLQAQEYFGEFKRTLIGEFVEAKPRPKFKLFDEFQFSDPNGLLWVVPKQAVVDGASIPQAFWSFIGGPFDGNYIKASVIHDHYCDIKTRTSHDTHRIFYYGMRSAGVEEWKAKFMYWAVVTFGPSWSLEKRVVQQLSCAEGNNEVHCEQKSAFKTELVSVTGVDLDDPETLGAALSKAAAVARTLRTSNGKLLDVANSGQISGDLESISNNADSYRTLFKDRSFMQHPEQLGLLSQWDAKGLDQVKRWEGNRVPTLNDAMLLKPTTIDSIESGKAFKLTPGSTELLRDRIDLRAIELRTDTLQTDRLQTDKFRTDKLR